jgi:hypothetical protein
MNVSHEGLSLWYDTPDAPAPEAAGLVPREGASLVLGVQPPNPTNTVVVRYRVDGGLVQTVSGRELRTDYARQAQYFGVTFPAFITGEVVEYAPILTCGGRQVPAPHLSARFPSKFRLAPRAVRPVQRPTHSPVPRDQRFTTSLDFVASVVVYFGDPEYVCDTAGGMRVNFFVKEGTLTGEGLNGKVIENSSDQIIVRRDGMGVVRIRAVFAIADGGILDVETGGYVDFGPDGYRQALARALPARSPLVVTPLIATRHPRYRWLSRIQCIGVGYAHLDVGQARYDVYSTSSRPMRES